MQMLFFKLLFLISTLSIQSSDFIAESDSETSEEVMCHAVIGAFVIQSIPDPNPCSVTEVYKFSLVQELGITPNSWRWSVVSCSNSSNCTAFWSFVNGTGTGTRQPEIMLWGCGTKTIEVTAKCIGGGNISAQYTVNLGYCC